MKMKSKEDKDRADRAAHKAQLQAKKAVRSNEPVLQSGTGHVRTEKPRMLIYCEGEVTEPSYFEKFKPANVDLKAFGEGRNTLSLVKQAIVLRNDVAADPRKRYDEVWCVFDRDPARTNGGGHSPANFNDAVDLANREGIGVAYSIQAFEYWLILHFNDHQGAAMERDDYGYELNKHLEPLGCYYDSKDRKEVTQAIFDALEVRDPRTGKRRRELASIRAKRNHDAKAPHSNPAADESTTTVYELVARLTA